MRIEYRNQIAPSMREYTRTFATPQDWTIDGIKALTLAFRGQTDNARQLLYITVEDDNGAAASATIGDSCSIQADEWNDESRSLTHFSDRRGNSLLSRAESHPGRSGRDRTRVSVDLCRR